MRTRLRLSRQLEVVGERDAHPEGAPPDRQDGGAEGDERVGPPEGEACDYRFWLIWLAAGPSTTTKIGGKMNNTSGNMIFTGSLAAFSRAH